MAEDPLIEAVAGEVRRPVPLTSRVEERALARLRELRRPNRRTWRIGGPLAALAVAAGIAAIFLAGILVGRRYPAPVREAAGHAPSEAGGTVATTVDTVDFLLRTSADSAVVLVGDFNDWDPAATPLQRVADGLWAVALPLRPGRYRYTFIVDGTRWLRDPSSPPALEDDFGAPTSVITVARR